MSKKVWLLLIVVVLLLIVIVLGSLAPEPFSFRVGNVASVHAWPLDVYGADGGDVSHVDWGEICPGDTLNHTLTLVNPTSRNFTLTLTSENWMPVNATAFFVLSWNREGYVLAGNQAVDATFCLAANLNVSGIDAIAFDIVVCCAS